jgi:hypothetical protein
MLGDQKRICEHIQKLLKQTGEGREAYLLSLLSWLLTTVSLEYPDKQVTIQALLFYKLEIWLLQG